jgi:hypothetical protein
VIEGPAVDNLDEKKCNYLIQIWESYVRRSNDTEKIVSEITKYGFFKILALLYYKLKDIELKISMNKVFCDLLSLNDNQNEILINDGIIKFLAQEIERFQFSKVEILKYIIFSCINIAKGTIGQNELLCNSGIIYKIIDITNFYINDNLDKEIRDLLINCIICLCNAINGSAGKTRENITSSYMRMLEWVTVTYIPKFDLGFPLFIHLYVSLTLTQGKDKGWRRNFF